MYTGIPPGPKRTFPYSVARTVNLAAPLVAADAPTATTTAAATTATPTPTGCSPSFIRHSFSYRCEYRQWRDPRVEPVGSSDRFTGFRSLPCGRVLEARSPE